MSESTGHKIEEIGAGRYRLSWVVPRWLDGGGRLPPLRYSRETDRSGAERFSRKWGIPGPWDKRA